MVRLSGIKASVTHPFAIDIAILVFWFAIWTVLILPIVLPWAFIIGPVYLISTALFGYEVLTKSPGQEISNYLRTGNYNGTED